MQLSMGLENMVHIPGKGSCTEKQTLVSKIVVVCFNTSSGSMNDILEGLAFISPDLEISQSSGS